MASSAHHYPAQHSRYPASVPQNSRDDPVRLPSIKELHFDYTRRGSQDGSPHNPNTSGTSLEPSINSQDIPVRWSRSNAQPQSPTPMSGHFQQQQQQQHHHQQQHTPPLSAGHETTQLKTDYSSKPDNGGFLTPGMPLSAQSTPVPGSVTIGPGTRGDEAPQSKRRRSSGNMSASRDARSPHPAYSHYYPPSQPQQPSYHQMQAPMSHTVHPGQPPLEHVHAQQVTSPAHSGYSGYPPPPPQYMHARAHPQQQPTPTNPYPSPAPPPQWEQPTHSQPLQHQPPVPQHQHQPHAPSHIQPPLQHTLHTQPPHPSHVMPQHQQPPPPSQHHHMHAQHQPHPPQQTIPPPVAHHPQHPQAQAQQQQAPSQIQHSQMPYARTTAIVPIDTRSQYLADEHERMPSARDSTISEIMKHCSALLNFASRYAQIQQSVQMLPSQQELAEMSHRAIEVIRLLEEYRRLNLTESERVKIDNSAVITPPDDHRPPKRPWEDMAQDENADATDSASFVEQQYPTPVDKAQSTAEQDMEIIRTKRATSTAGGSGSAGQPKSKYRKRSRATPPGKCHSCNIRETPEWRRGPDGARTLCNACGLHYAKLQRKRDKQAGPDGEAPRIDMETLRASARAADVADKSHSRSKHSARSQQSTEPTSPMETGKPLPLQHHQGSFQLLPMMPPDPPSAQTDSNRVSSQQQQPHEGILQVGPPVTVPAPPPPWSTSVQSSAPAARGYPPDQLQHQSFMRTSHQATNHTSPR